MSRFAELLRHAPIQPFTAPERPDRPRNRLNLPSPDDVLRRYRRDPAATMSRFNVQDRLVFYATHEDGSHSMALGYVVGDQDPGVATRLNDLFQTTKRHEDGQARSPIMSIELVHAISVLSPWSCEGELKLWIRESVERASGVVVTAGAESLGTPLVSAVLPRLADERKAKRAEVDESLTAAGWRLL